MTSASAPQNESERLASLRRYGILDTPPEAEFDDLAFLATQILNTPIAAIALLSDQRLWVKSKVGFDVSEIPRQWAFCAHTILQNDVFVIPDTLKDDRFRDNPLATGESGIRFYAGMPLTTAEGYNLGTLCVMDRVPRGMIPGQGEALKRLSRQIMERIEWRAEQARQRALAEALSDYVFRIRADGTFLSYSAPAAETFIPREQIVGSTLQQIMPLEIAGLSMAALAKALETGRLQTFRYSLEMPGGRREYLARMARSGVDEVMAAVSDVTESEACGQALKTERDRLRQILDSIFGMVVVLSLDGRVVEVNGTTLEVLGITRDQGLGRPIWETFPFTHSAELGIEIRESLRQVAQGAIVRRERPVQSAGGRLFFVDGVLSPLRGQGGEIIGIVGFGVDVTERRRADELLRESEERFREVMEHVESVFWSMDASMTKLLYISPGYEKVWGRTCASLYAQPRSFIEAVHPEDRERVTANLRHKHLKEGAPFEIEYRIVQPNGTVRWIRDRGFPIRDASGRFLRMVGIADDITDRLKMQHEAWRSQRLESLGTLAAGISHDLNNILAPIVVAGDLLKSEFPKASTELIGIIENAGRRGSDIVRQLLAFTRRTAEERGPVNPKYLLEDIAKIVKQTFPKSIQVEVRYSPEMGSVLVNLTQMHQVLLNLCLNARDAMPDGGTLCLAAEQVECGPATTGYLGDTATGRYCRIRVQDTGAGIAPEIIDRIFEPFFTTKDPQKGTGLGLFTSLGIVKSHGGFLRVESQPGRGSCFEVYLPASGLEAVTVAEELVPKLQGHRELVLVVDDEPAVRGLLEKALDQFNFQVITAVNGADALLRFHERRSEISLILTDIDMPVMDGLSFVEALRGTASEIPVILMTGLHDEVKLDRLQNLGIQEILAKPFGIVKLAEVLKRSGLVHS